MRAELQRLAEEARERDGEVFLTVRSSPQYRLQLWARHPGRFFVEVIVDLFPGGEVDLEHLERFVTLLTALRERDHVLSCGEDRSVSAELKLRMESIEEEAAAADASARAAMGWGLQPG